MMSTPSSIANLWYFSKTWFLPDRRQYRTCDKKCLSHWAAALMTVEPWFVSQETTFTNFPFTKVISAEVFHKIYFQAISFCAVMGRVGTRPGIPLCICNALEPLFLTGPKSCLSQQQNSGCYSMFICVITQIGAFTTSRKHCYIASFPGLLLYVCWFNSLCRSCRE